MRNEWFLLPLIGVAVYGFMNGWGAGFGICPPGYTAAGGECTNSLIGNDAPSGDLPPTTALTPPQVWAWSPTGGTGGAGGFVAVYPTPSWPSFSL
jgi:hypothetical protein